MKFWMFDSIFSTESLPYSVMRFLGVTVELGIVMMFGHAPIHHDCFALYAKFSLNRSMDFDSLSKSSGSLSMALLKILMTVVDV